MLSWQKPLAVWEYLHRKQKKIVTIMWIVIIIITEHNFKKNIYTALKFKSYDKKSAKEKVHTRLRTCKWRKSSKYWYLPNFTGNPGGNFICTNLRSLVKCLNGAITSSTLNNISTERGKSEL